MKKVLLIISLISIFTLTSCNKDNSTEKVYKNTKVVLNMKTYKKEVGNLRSLNKKEIYLIMMDEYEKRREKEIKREMYYICENITLLKKRLVVLREELLSLGDNKDKELENGKVKKLTYKRKKYQNNRKEHFE